jgi:4-hydroxy-tetrahydrodipicolinate reductase
VEEFAVRVTQRDIRHVGLTESMQFLASGLGWNLDRTEDVVECVIATADVESPHICVRRGEASGVYQHGHGYVGDREVITMEFRASIGEPTIVDRVAIQGEPSTTIEIPGGVQGDTATCNVLVNTAAVLPRAIPGLRTMAELPTPSCSR